MSKWHPYIIYGVGACERGDPSPYKSCFMSVVRCQINCDGDIIFLQNSKKYCRIEVLKRNDKQILFFIYGQIVKWNKRG